MVLDKLLKNEKQILTVSNGTVKFYGNGFVKCIIMKRSREKGFEVWAKTKHDKLKEYMERVNLERVFEDDCFLPLSDMPDAPVKPVRTSRSASSVSRLRARIQELAFCNPWNCFVTFTLDPEKRDRYDIDEFEALTRHLKYVRQTRCPELRFMLILESHRDGAYHGHAFMYLPADFIASEFCVNSNGFLEWTDISSRFGYMCIKPFDGSPAAVFYVMKYVTKDILPGRVLRSSQGLKGAVIVATNLDIVFDNSLNVYRGDYCCTYFCTFEEFEKNIFNNLIEIYEKGY